MLSDFVKYVRQYWHDRPDKSTPINAERMNHIENGIEANANAIDEIARAVVSNIVNDPNKIASMAAVYALQEKMGTGDLPSDTPDIISAISALNSNLGKAFILYSARTSTTWTLNADAGAQYISDTGLLPTIDGYTGVFLSGHPNGVSGIIVYDNGWIFNTNQSERSFTLTVNWLFIKNTLFQ